MRFLHMKQSREYTYEAFKYRCFVCSYCFKMNRPRMLKTLSILEKYCEGEDNAEFSMMTPKLLCRFGG